MPIATEGSGTPTTRPETGPGSRGAQCRGGWWGWGGWGADLFLCPYPPKVQARPPRDQRPVRGLGASSVQGGWGGWGADLFLCPYPPKVQARPPRDQRPVWGLGAGSVQVILCTGVFRCWLIVCEISVTKGIKNR